MVLLSLISKDFSHHPEKQSITETRTLAMIDENLWPSQKYEKNTRMIILMMQT